MALNVKPVPIVAPQGVTTTTRPASGPRAGASASLSGPVDASVPISGSGSGLGDGAFASVVTQDNNEFSGRSFSPGARREQGNDLPDPKTGIIEFTSQGFAELLELRDTVSGASGNADGKNRGKAMGRGIEYASALYENVIELAAGNRNLLGETVSITL